MTGDYDSILREKKVCKRALFTYRCSGLPVEIAEAGACFDSMLEELLLAVPVVRCVCTIDGRLFSFGMLFLVSRLT